MHDPVVNAFEIAQARFDKIADRLEVDQATRLLLRSPMKEYHCLIPVRMDDGQVKVFRGFRVVHNDARGPAKGGIRFHPLETIDTIRALAMGLTWKCALIGLPLGGSHGGVICDPHNLSLREQERLCRGWVRPLARDLGPHVDVPAPDIMTNPRHMMWMLDEFEALRGEKLPGFITGKPVGMGGSQGRREAVGFGLVFAIREALKELNLAPEETTASVQGFGNVGQYSASLYRQIGGRVVCVSCWNHEDQKSYAFRDKSGLDVDALLKITNNFGEIDKAKALALGCEVLPGEAWLEQDVDILIPAAIENQITEDEFRRIPQRVKLIVEGANGPTTPEADALIAGRGIFLIPDILANAGGVTCSYFEQVQGQMNYFWTKDEVLGQLDTKITAAFHEALEAAKRESLTLRDAAYFIAVARVVEACQYRGWV